jgi:CBS domain-containing protein
MLSTVPFSSAAGLDRPVVEIMRRGRITVPAERALVDVLRAMTDHGVHAILVTGADACPLGWVTSRGVLHNHARDWTVATAADAITEQVASVPTTATIGDALRAFIASGASHVLVGAERGGGLPGVVADSDLVSYLARALDS